jgi:hypothetical protein
MKAKILFFEIFVTRGKVTNRLAWRIEVGSVWIRWLFHRLDTGIAGKSLRII